MGASILEQEAGARHKILHRVGDEHFARACERSDTRSDVNRDSRELRPNDFTFTSVNTRTQIEAHESRLGGDRLRGPNRAGRAIERCEKPIARSVDFPAAKCREFPTHHCMVAVQKFPPPAIAQRHSMFGRADDVGEEHGGEYSVIVCGAHAYQPGTDSRASYWICDHPADHRRRPHEDLFHCSLLFSRTLPRCSKLSRRRIRAGNLQSAKRCKITGNCASLRVRPWRCREF